MHVEPLPDNFIAGAGGAAGSAQDVCHQPPDTLLDIYRDYYVVHNDAASTVVKAARLSAWGSEIEPRPKQIFCF